VSAPDRTEHEPRDPYPAYDPYTGAEPRPEGDDPYEPHSFEDVERGYRPIHPEPAWRSLARKLWAPIAGLGLLLWKLKFLFVALFKFKLFTVAGSMLVSIGAYALLWGWKFAVGFVLLLLVHELGHALEAKRQGLPVSAPVFIPFLGAAILLKGNPEDAWREAKVAIAGPILGSLGALAVWGVGEWQNSEFLIALAFTGFFLNLFNLLPIVPLDGGRIVAAVHPVLWGLGLAGLAGLALIAPNPILIIILLFGSLELWRRWKEWRSPDPAVRAYYSVTTGQRVLAGIGYIGLAALLAVLMAITHVKRDI
jgi:Zn-dependent protease